MKKKQEILERIEDIDKAIKGLQDSGNLEEIHTLTESVATLLWVLEK